MYPPRLTKITELQYFNLVYLERIPQNKATVLRRIWYLHNAIIASIEPIIANVFLLLNLKIPNLIIFKLID